MYVPEAMRIYNYLSLGIKREQDEDEEMVGAMFREMVGYMDSGELVVASHPSICSWEHLLYVNNNFVDNPKIQR